MSAARAIPLEELKAVLPLLTAEETIYAYKLVKQMEALAPVEEPKPANEIEKIGMEVNLADFFREAWKVLEPGHGLMWSWHYEYICEHLMLVAQKKLRRLIINVPPRTAKSNLVTKCFPVWMWLADPSVSFLFVSYSNALSTDHSIGRRNLITSRWHQALWSEKYRLADDRNLTTQYANDHMGQMIATSTGSGAEGRGADIAILDDPMSSGEALSDAERTTSNRWFSTTLKQRLNDPATAAIIVIMQRLHEMDTTGYAETEDPGVWTKIQIPLVAEKDEAYTFPISGRVVERKRGDVLQPDRFTPEVVQEKQRNRLIYAGQYQQHPAPLEGNLIKRSEIRYYGGRNPVSLEQDEPLPDKFDFAFVTADCSFKDLKTSDYVAIGAVGVKGRKRFLLTVTNAHLDVDATESEIKKQRTTAQQAGHYVSAVLVEDKANGSAVISRLKKNVSGVIAVEPEGGKIARFVAAAPEWQAGDWYVDRNAMWAEPFVQQITMFPMAANDDMCDMMSQAAIWLGSSIGVLGLVDYLKSGMAQKHIDQVNKEMTPKGLESALPANGTMHPCPSCGFETTNVIAGNQRRCVQCGHQFQDAKTVGFQPKRADLANGGMRVGRN